MFAGDEKSFIAFICCCCWESDVFMDEGVNNEVCGRLKSSNTSAKRGWWRWRCVAEESLDYSNRLAIAS